MNDLFETIIQDFEFVQGDTVNIPFEFFDKNKNPINDIVNQDWECLFSIVDPITDQIITSLQKTHNDVAPAGDGVYYNNDVNTIPGLGIVNNNQVVIVLSAAESATLIAAVHKYYFRFIINQAYASKYTAARGNLKIKKRDT
jgi:hypothetical protein